MTKSNIKKPSLWFGDRVHMVKVWPKACLNMVTGAKNWLTTLYQFLEAECGTPIGMKL